MRIIKLIAICFCFSSFQHVLGQNTLPKAYQIKTDTISVVTLPDSLWQFVEDKTATWTIDSVQQLAYANKFQCAFADTKQNLMQNFWVRYRLKNNMDKEAKISLKFFSVNQCDMYLLGTNGSERHLLSGTDIVWSKRDGIKFENINGNNFIQISILPNEEIIVYIKNWAIDGRNNSELSIRLYSNEKMNTELSLEAEQNYFGVMSDSFFFGVLFLAFIFNFSFYLIVKDSVYLYFSLYVFFLGLIRFADELYYLFFRENPSTLLSIRLLCYHFIPIWFIFFLRSLLKISLKYPIWDKVLLILVFVLLSFYILHNLDFLTSWHPITSNILFFYQILVYYFLLATLFLYIRTPEESVKKIIFGILPAFSIWVICWSMLFGSFSLNRLFNIPFQFFYDQLAANWRIIENVCLLWMVVYFSWFLLRKFGELKKQIVQKELHAEIERSQLIEEQNSKLEEQVAQRTAELNQSLETVKATQTQLIQKEKLASLGELTAGIAHEIQNPLNFVNNFSEASAELVTELEEEQQKPERDTELEADLLGNLKQNLQKIHHHGGRASAIVKGMLEHSRSSTGEARPTDLNALAGEYLKIAYQGQRAKAKDFTCQLITDVDPSLRRVEVMPQEIGRVLLNLFNNAFYAVQQRATIAPTTYEPTVSVGTKAVVGGIEIRVSDNGTGIPAGILDKIFQPFFTTKPTGEGTGLGLSLSYDIITKGHGGTFCVESVEGEGSTFVVGLPVS